MNFILVKIEKIIYQVRDGSRKEKQYKSTQYLEARIKIHQFTKNKIGFHEWIFNQYDLSVFNDKALYVLGSFKIMRDIPSFDVCIIILDCFFIYLLTYITL